ncbi:hypothetical protein WICPIJ_003452 [Wickerhamomyces pijperi]|uniref:Uncharacterized protein n=1 Tax=Wickerhamomyces pijperi TaxID=599730 RepID=A0A9P8Q9K1_WICPI|nr:hypothetical protein WICPIJ_003452 [Wickerhamomyces pijperi]
MELDQVLYGLDPLVKACEDRVQSFQELYKDSYVRLLDQLAILLRDESARSDELITNNLSKLVSAAEYLISNIDLTQDFRELSKEFIRVLANVVADNDDNRQIVATESFICVLGLQLENNFDDNEINERVLILLKNLIIDNETLEAKISKIISENLLVYLGYEGQFMAIDLFADLITHSHFKNSVKVLQLFIRKTSLVLETAYEDEDELSELLINLSFITETLTMDSKLNFAGFETSLQTSLFDILTKLQPMLFPNKLKAQRKFYSSMGNISANLTSTNPTSLALPYIVDESESNGYVLSSAMVILGNSITSAELRSQLLETCPTLISVTLSKYTFLTDPIQFQGILHLLKALVSPLTVSELFTESSSSLKNLDSLIEATIRNSQYYTNFTTLLIKFLQRLIVLINNKATLSKFLALKPIELIQSSNNKDSFHIIILLLINKIAIYTPEQITTQEIEAVLNFNLSQIQVDHLFELTKTIGVLFKQHADVLINQYKEKLCLVLNTVNSVGENGGMAGKAIKNNGEYVAGMVVNYYKEKNIAAEQDELLIMAKSFF